MCVGVCVVAGWHTLLRTLAAFLAMSSETRGVSQRHVKFLMSGWGGVDENEWEGKDESEGEREHCHWAFYDIPVTH